jgi:hypothetical protein
MKMVPNELWAIRLVVEHTGAWFNRYRRLRIRDERRADIQTAFVSLAPALILRTAQLPAAAVLKCTFRDRRVVGIA